MNRLKPLVLKLARLARDQRGVSAVEFALIAPFLIMTYFGVAELSQGITVQRRVSHAASAMGDLVAQADTTLATSDMNDMFAAASDLLSPFATGNLNLRVTSITGNASGAPRVDWSDASGPGLSAYKHCDTVTPTLPTGLITAAGDSVIMAEATYSYTATIAKIVPGGFNLNEHFYLRPRKVAHVLRAGASTTAC